MEQLFEKSNAEIGQLLFDEKEQNFYTFLMDEEGDIFRVDYHHDDCAKISNPDLSFLTLSRENLNTILELLDETEEYYKHANNPLK